MFNLYTTFVVKFFGSDTQCVHFVLFPSEAATTRCLFGCTVPCHKAALLGEKMKDGTFY